MVGRGRSIRVSSNSIISDISDISVVVVGGVLDMLGTAIRKSNIIRSRNNTSSISSLSSVEVSLGVVISNSVLVGIGLISIGWLRGMVSRGSVDSRGVVSRGSMVDRSSMVSRSMSKDSLSSMKTVRRVSNSSNSCSESLGLSGAPVLSLVWPGH